VEYELFWKLLVKVHFCSFASPSFLKAQALQASDIEKLGIVKSDIHPLTIEVLDENFFRQIPYASEENRFGFFSFKPYILERLLNNLSDGDLLLYLDVNDRPLIGLKEYAVKIMSDQEGLNILSTSTNYPNRKHSSKFHIDRSTWFSACASLIKFQPEAGALIIKNNSETRSILRIWFELTMMHAKDLILSQDPESRHDQETLFLLSLINNTIKVESWYKYRYLKLGFKKYIDWEYYRGLS
jgi:hypothetical protein